MKQARGAGGLPGADDDDFTVVPVESTSESISLMLHCFPIRLTMHQGWHPNSEQLMELQQVKVHQCSLCVLSVCTSPVSQVKRPGYWMQRVWLWAAKSPLQRKKLGTWWTAPSTGQRHLSTNMATFMHLHSIFLLLFLHCCFCLFSFFGLFFFFYL